jgi:oxygen-independent coproporphyrinogen-3 oxidase
MKEHKTSALISKYDVAVPRYTSYPTVPCWQDNMNAISWKDAVKNSFIKHKQQGISLYIHLPFCEKLCTYCGCNKRITKNHQVEIPYIQTLLKEWNMYLDLFEEKPFIQEIHLGGGTPSFFSAENLASLIKNILASSLITPETEMSIEVHPNYTSVEQLDVLYQLGFRRLSVGIQDFDEKVQYIINRPQTFEQTQYIIEQARKIGYTSINADIIYGLPLQTAESVRKTIELVNILMPERIAFYSYAHVPWKSPAQRRYTEADLPKSHEKRYLYELGRDLLKKAGYIDIGLDHFSLPSDTLAIAAQEGTLHRNFMGYTTQKGQLLIGLGASAISDTGDAFMQNEKGIEAYQEQIEKGNLALHKSHLLSEKDLQIRKHILDVMCRYATTFENDSIDDFYFDDLMADGLVIYQPPSLQVTELGKMFLRNIAFRIDQRRSSMQHTSEVFSKAI